MTPSTSGMRAKVASVRVVPCLGEALQADVVRLEREVQTECFVGGLQDLQGARGDFRSDAVAG